MCNKHENQNIEATDLSAASKLCSDKGIVYMKDENKNSVMLNAIGHNKVILKTASNKVLAKMIRDNIAFLDQQMQIKNDWYTSPDLANAYDAMCAFINDEKTKWN
jgi:hypothetical protein